MADRLLRAKRTILLVPLVDIAGVPSILGGTKAAPVTCPMTAPTAAVLNTWAAVVNSSNAIAGIGGNISAATLDDVSLGLADSDTVTELVVTSLGDEESLTLYNVDAVFEFMRDQDPYAAGVFNLARDLTINPDTRYGIVDRAVGGYLATDAFAAGQSVDIYEVFTDVSPDDAGDKTSIKYKQTFIPSGNVAVGVTVA